MTRALLVVDLQNDFCEGGSLPVSGGAAVAGRIAALLASDHGYDYVVATRDHHIDPGAHFSATPDYVDSWPPHCVAGTPGAELHPAVAGFGFAAVFDKGEYAAAYSGFEGRSAGVTLADWLVDRHVTAVDVAGLAADYCVRATALDAARDGFAVGVLLDLTAAISPDRLDAALDEFVTAGVILTSVSDATSGDLAAGRTGRTRVAWSDGVWTNPPADISVSGDGIAVTAVEGSDAWRHTAYGFVHDTEHALLAPLAVGQAVEVRLRTTFAGEFDQAGVFVKADNEHWVKAGLEFADGVLNLGAVVTLERSDWSIAPVDWNGREVTVRVSRSVESLAIRAKVDDEPFRLLRVAPFSGRAVTAGPFLCAPTRAGFTANFLSWEFVPADTSLH